VTGRPALALAAVALAAALVVGVVRGPAGHGLGIVRIAAGDEVATGFTAGGRVVTVAHVLQDAAPASARIARVDGAADLAVLDAPGLRAAPAPPVGGVRILVLRGGHVVALPASVRSRVTAQLRGADGRRATRAALILDADVRRGDSGAPVVAPGRLVGVVFASSTRRPHTAYAVDATRNPLVALAW
jgi:hypothetical protein